MWAMWRACAAGEAVQRPMLLRGVPDLDAAEASWLRGMGAGLDRAIPRRGLPIAADPDLNGRRQTEGIP